MSSLTNAFAELITLIQFAEVCISMYYFQLMYRIGASGVVYGWMGMRLVKSLMLPNLSRLNALDCFFLISALVHDLQESALSLDDFQKIPLLEGDGIDHTAHVMGVVSGMIWALLLILWEKLL